MRGDVRFIGVYALFLCICIYCQGQIIYVDAQGPNDPGTGSFADPFIRIQDGLNAAQDYDIVEIRPGTYKGAGNYNLDPNGKSITIKSTEPNDFDVAAKTIIDADKAGRGFCFDSNEDANCIVAGLTIQNCYNSECGGAIYCNDSSPRINCCIFRDNKCDSDGGAMGIASGSPTIENCIIFNNKGRYGGGIGIYGFGLTKIINCTIAGNRADFSGGGVYALQGNLAIKNCILWQNKLKYAQDSNGFQVGLEFQSEAFVSYSDIEGGQEGVSSVESTLQWLSENMDIDPCFAAFESNGDPNIWDFHLKSCDGRWDSHFYNADFNENGNVELFDFSYFAKSWEQEGNNLNGDLNRDSIVDTADLAIFCSFFLTDGKGGKWTNDTVTSHCIDAGDPNSNWGNELWPNGKRINIGSYGGTSQGSKNGNIADFNVDYKVNLTDFAQISSKWAAKEHCLEDLTNNSIVDFADLLVFSDNWLWQNP